MISPPSNHDHSPENGASSCGPNTPRSLAVQKTATPANTRRRSFLMPIRRTNWRLNSPCETRSPCGPPRTLRRTWFPPRVFWPKKYPKRSACCRRGGGGAPGGAGAGSVTTTKGIKAAKSGREENNGGTSSGVEFSSDSRCEKDGGATSCGGNTEGGGGKITSTSAQQPGGHLTHVFSGTFFTPQELVKFASK